MKTRIRALLAPQVAYATRWPLRTYAVTSGQRVCGLEHRKIRGACPNCKAAV